MRSSLGQTLIKVNPPVQLTKHLGKVRLYMVFTLFANSLKKFFEQIKK